MEKGKFPAEVFNRRAVQLKTPSEFWELSWQLLTLSSAAFSHSRTNDVLSLARVLNLKTAVNQEALDSASKGKVSPSKNPTNSTAGHAGRVAKVDKNPT